MVENWAHRPVQHFVQGALFSRDLWAPSVGAVWEHHPASLSGGFVGTPLITHTHTLSVTHTLTSTPTHPLAKTLLTKHL